MRGWHLAAYTLATGGSVTDADMTAVTDPELSIKNNHYTFTENFKAKGFYAAGANLSRVNISVPRWNQVNKINVWPVNKSLNIPSPPQLDWYDDYPIALPLTEEFAIKATDSASEQVTVFMWITPEGYDDSLPMSQVADVMNGSAPGLFEIRFTATTPSLTANTWSGLSAITFEQTPRSGVYAIVGSMFQGAGLMAARWVFGRAPIYKNRKLRPGYLAQQNIGDLEWSPLQFNRFKLGEAGRFHTYEPPQVEYYANAGGIITVEGRMWVVWLNEGREVIY